MIKQSLSQKMLQKLSPQQIQLMKLLQIPTATLDQRIKEELESNPALDEGNDSGEVFDVADENETADGEEVENYELDDYLKEYIEDDPISYKVKSDNFSADDEDKAIPIAIEESFNDHLLKQLDMIHFEVEKNHTIAQQIIGSIDSDGYLRRSLEAMQDDLMFAQNVEVTVEEIRTVLERVQLFEPAGLGSRDLKECLLLQLIRKKEIGTSEEQNIRETAIKILQYHFEEFSKKHYTKLQKHLFISESELKDAISEILKLNPKPASNFVGAGDRTNQYIVPDFIITNRDGELDLTLNSKNAPDLRINDNYLDMLKSYNVSNERRKSTKKEKEAVMFIKQKIDSAKWFIDAIKQRQETLSNTMYSIMQFQFDYFTSGDEKQLRPMILKDIAEITNLDISTISRVANSKFVQTEFGTKRLKDFFSESLQTQDGTLVSTLEVKNILNDIIVAENKKKPFSDEKLKNMLLKKGYNIARRTVAKYREQLNIPVARLRKEL